MSGWRPRLVALDVDGTLLHHDGTMSPVVRDVVRATADAGIVCVIATGRSVPGVTQTADMLGFRTGHAVASNGSLVLEYDPVKILRAVTFDASDAVCQVLEHMPTAMVAVEEVGVGYRVNREFPRGELHGRITVEEIEPLIAEPVTRVIVRSPDHSVDEFHAMAQHLGLEDTNYYIGYTAWLDIAPKGVSKASGLEFLCDHLGFEQADVLAVGDGRNDIEMLEWAGRGVAMGHAPDVLKDAADAVTATVAADGLVPVLERYL